jgi:DNA-binding NarL/FixJ family response regulator
MYTILIIDDHPLTRRGLMLTLEAEPDFKVCCQQRDAEGVMSCFATMSPQLAIVDLSLPGISAYELIKYMHSQRPELPILAISPHPDPASAVRALRAGGRGYVTKEDPCEAVIEAARHLLEGGFYVTGEVNDLLLSSMASERGLHPDLPAEVLSGQEMRVFELTGNGLATREIAEQMGLSVKTVESYRYRIKSKLNLRTAAELMQHAIRWVDSAGAK